MRLVIISGRSGSGKSSALDVLEDIGFYCIDNLPIVLLPALVNETHREERLANIAVSVDARNLSSAFDQIESVLHQLPLESYQVDVVYLDASEDVLMQRFSATRRKHPLTNSQTSLAEAIEQEKRLLEPIVNLADLTLDTTDMSIHELRRLVKLRVADRSNHDIAILFKSFGFKYGIPKDADYVFDVRNLPNPYWKHELRSYTGQDTEIKTYLESKEKVHEMASDLQNFISNWLPSFIETNRSYMTIAIGCTGGQHRSVYMSERLSQHFKHTYTNVQVRHRELDLPS